MKRRMSARTVLIIVFFTMLCIFAIGRGNRAMAVTISYTCPYTDEVVHTLYWKAQIKTDVTITMNGEEVELPSGTSCTLVYLRSFTKETNKSILRYKSVKFSLENKYITLVKAKVIRRDYNRYTKLWFVNTKIRSYCNSTTGYLIWVALSRQRVYVFSGSQGNWQLIKTYKCSSGLSNPNAVNLRSSVTGKYLVKDYLRWFTSFGGSGFHNWPETAVKKHQLLGKYPSSHNCIRLDKAPSLWIYNNIPIGTRVIFF